MFASGCFAPTPPVAADMSKRSIAAQPSGSSEVELSGTITRPNGVSGSVRVWTASAPCARANGKAYGDVRAENDRWALKAFLPQGSPIFICAAISDGKNAYDTWGQAASAPVIGHEAGAVTLTKIEIALKRGSKVAPPNFQR